jgi:hypothetical protein
MAAPASRAWHGNKVSWARSRREMERGKWEVLPGLEAVSATRGSRQSAQDRASDGRLAQSTAAMARRRAAPCRKDVGMTDGVGDGRCAVGRKIVLRGPVVREKGGPTSGPANEQE